MQEEVADLNGTATLESQRRSLNRSAARNDREMITLRSGKLDLKPMRVRKPSSR